MGLDGLRSTIYDDDLNHLYVVLWNECLVRHNTSVLLRTAPDVLLLQARVSTSHSG